MVRHGTSTQARTILARRGTENLGTERNGRGTENSGTIRYWHGLAQNRSVDCTDKISGLDRRRICCMCRQPIGCLYKQQTCCLDTQQIRCL